MQPRADESPGDKYTKSAFGVFWSCRRRVWRLQISFSSPAGGTNSAPQTH